MAENMQSPLVGVHPQQEDRRRLVSLFWSQHLGPCFEELKD